MEGNALLVLWTLTLCLIIILPGKCSSQAADSSSSTVMLCPPVSAPANGYLKGKCHRPATGDTCTLFCNGGYKLVPSGWGKKLQKDGSLDLKCLEDGSWDQHKNQQDPQVATCHGPSECRSDVSKIKDGFSRGPCATGYAGQVCSYSCRPGYKLQGPSGIVCLPSGKWNKDPPTCVVDEYGVGIKCSNLIYSQNGGVFLGSCSPGRLKQQCRLVCAHGHQVVSTQTGTPQVVLEPERTIFTCTSSGYWDKPAHGLECQREKWWIKISNSKIQQELVKEQQQRNKQQEKTKDNLGLKLQNLTLVFTLSPLCVLIGSFHCCTYYLSFIFIIPFRSLTPTKTVNVQNRITFVFLPSIT